MITTYNHIKENFNFTSLKCLKVNAENTPFLHESSQTLCKSPYFKLCLTKYTGIFALLCFKWKLNTEK
ncbi:hypothetical protein T4C_4800 [Trichinella pseudospiralis]|uniref:Uncharacterized protein n=1 Tax=Trichinella pseudospiralis TaxID=6337 RepID=A0A0V1IXD2_TRIPS|nr:hypothetical protein T4D_7751 [Trichinella pseudospiralis]KRZ27380.1 hypothetical protein T4C_4800 [Trichinella pseudospiralis]